MNFNNGNANNNNKTNNNYVRAVFAFRNITICVGSQKEKTKR